MKKLLFLAIVVLGISAVSFGQSLTNSATATASATITTPMTLKKNVDLAFGNIVAGVSTGKVIVSPDGGASYPDKATGPDANPIPGTITAASFEVAGSPEAYFVIGAIAAITVKSNAQGASVMNVTDFKTNLNSLPGRLGSNGKATITIGATLTVGAGQTAGYYTSENPFEVTVNYN